MPSETPPESPPESPSETDLAASHLYEIQLGVYATPHDAQRLVEACTRLLDDRAWPYRLSVAGPGQSTAPGGMPLTEFYDELPQQWRIEHRGADPGARQVHEIRVGLLAPEEQRDDLRAELTRVACPDPEHSSPCPVPWSAGYTEAAGRSEDATEAGTGADEEKADREDGVDGVDGDESGAYLEQQYGQLRRS